MFATGVRTFVEVGPRRVVSGLISAILPPGAADIFAMDPTGGRQYGLADLARTLCRLAARGHTVAIDRWEEILLQGRKPVLDIPVLGANTKPAPSQVASSVPPLQPVKSLAAAATPSESQPTHNSNPNPMPCGKNTMHEPKRNPAPGFATEAFKAIQEGLKSIQMLQQTTAETHQRFLESQTEASRTLQKMIEQTQHLAASASGLPVSPAPAAVPADPRPVVQPAQEASVMIAPSPPAEPPPMVSAAPTALPPIQTAPATMSDQPSPEGALPTDTDGLTATLLAVASELTGYPAEMLGLDMDIEADLGIDSIKRVEILSAVEERVPDLPPISPDVMGSLKTLGEIVAYLARQTDAAPAVEAACVQQPLPEPAAAPSCSPGDLENILREVVSQLTGYPVEMLGLDMDIEADLGIDSIKRVEILSAVEERLPDLPPIPPDKAGSLKTLGQIIELISQSDRADVPCSTHVEAPKAPCENIGVPEIARQEVVVRKKNFKPGRPLEFSGPAKVLIGGNAPTLAGAVAEALKSRGLDVEFIPLDGRALPAGGSPAAGVILFGSDDETFDADALKNSFRLAKAAAPASFLATVSRMDGAFGFGSGDFTNPMQGGLAGLAKTAALEWPDVLCRAFDVDSSWNDPAAIAKQIAAELLEGNPGDPVEVGLTPAERVVLDLSPRPYPPVLPSLDLAAGDVVLVTGGGRGVTAAALMPLARLSRATFILLGRSPRPGPEPPWLTSVQGEGEIKKAILANQFPGPPPSPRELEEQYKLCTANREIRQALANIEGNGGRAFYYAVDVRDTEALQAVLREVHDRHGAVRALIHGAGVLEDRLILDKKPEQFDRVFDTKVAGLEALLQSLQEDSLRYLVLFSSVSARFGNLGQVDYAMANEVLNKTARRIQTRLPDCRVVAVNWGPWDGGMVSPSLKREFTRRGVSLIPLETGAGCLLYEMAQGTGDPVEIVIGDGLTPVREKTPEPSDGPFSGADLNLMAEREVDIDRYPILKDHILDGTPVFPFALMAEWLGYAAMHENPGLTLHGLDDMRLLKGIRLNREKMTVRLMAGKPEKEGNAYRVAVELRDGVQQSMPVVHTGARALLADGPLVPPSFEMPNFRNARKYVKPVTEVYRDILFHGIELQGIREIRTHSPEGMVALIRTAPPPNRWMSDPLRSRWIGDPLVVDAAFQMAIVWTFEEMGAGSLPTYFASYRQYARSFPPEEVTAVMAVREATPHKLTCDFTFLDGAGGVLAQLTGYEAVVDASLERAFQKTG